MRGQKYKGHTLKILEFFSILDFFQSFFAILLRCHVFKVGNLTVINEKEYQKVAITKAIEQGVFVGDGKSLDCSEVMNKGDFCVVLERLGYLK